MIRTPFETTPFRRYRFGGTPTEPVEEPRSRFFPIRSKFLEIVFLSFPRLTPAHG